MGGKRYRFFFAPGRQPRVTINRELLAFEHFEKTFLEVLVATVPNFGYHAWRLLALLRAQVPSEPEDAVGNVMAGLTSVFLAR